MQRGERVGDAVLLEIVAGRHFAAEAVAAIGDGHLAGRVGRGLDQDGNVERGEAKRVGDGTLVAEIGQGDDDAVDHAGFRTEQLRAALGFFVRFDGTVLGLFRRESDNIETRFLQGRIISSRPVFAR